MSEAIDLASYYEDPAALMSQGELLAVMANGSVSSQIKYKESLLDMVLELPFSKRGSQIEEISADIVSLESEYDNPDSPTWKRYATTYTTATPELDAPMSNLALDSVTSYIEAATSNHTLGSKSLAELYDLSDALGPVLEDALRHLLDEIDVREQAELHSLNTVNLSIVPDLPESYPDDKKLLDEHETLIPVTIVASEVSTDMDSPDTLSPIHTSDLEPWESQGTNHANLTDGQQESLIIPNDFVPRLLDYLSTGAATHRDILCEIFKIVHPEIHEISIVLRILNKMVGDTILRDRYGKFLIPSSAQPIAEHSSNSESASLPTEPSYNQKRRRKVTRAASSLE